MGGWQPTLGTLAHFVFHFPISLVVIFGALCWRCFEDDFLGFLAGVTYEVLVPLWLVTLPPNLL
jgi:hypothetical protein